MSQWKIVRPLAATNWILNPSAETTGNYAVAVGGAVTRELGDGCYGNYGYKIVPAGVDRGISLTAATPTDPTQVYFAAKDVTGTLTVNATVSETAVPIQELGDDWWLYQAINTGFDGTPVRILNSVNETWYLDGIVYTADDALQTYLDGDQPGCSWSADAHASYSTRLVTARGGGEIVDFEDDLYFWVVNTPGDTTSLVNIISERPFRAGGSVDLNRIAARTMILLGWLRATTLPQLHTRHSALMDILRPDAVPLATDGRPQPVIIQYWGDERVLQLRAHYRLGLEEHQAEGSGFQIKIPLTFDVTDPYWESVIEIAAEVDTSETETAVLAFGRLNGDWDVMGPPAGPTTADGRLDLLETGTHVYLAGHEALNADADQAALARWNKLTDTWAGIGTPNDKVWRIIAGPDGSIYICGKFGTVDGGLVVANNVARYVPATDTWTAVGNIGGTTRDILFDEEGNLYGACGGNVYVNTDPTNPAAAWAQVGAATGITTIYALAIEPVRQPNWYYKLYAGGSGGDRFAYTNLEDAAPAWTAISGIDNTIYALEMMPDKTIYIGGAMTDHLLHFRRPGAITAVSNPPNNTVISLDYDPDNGTLYVAGSFSELGETEIGVTAARYYPASDTWAPLPISLANAPTTYYITRVRVGRYATAILGEPPRLRNLWFGFFEIGGVGHTTDLTYPSNQTIVTANVPGGAISKPIFTLSADDAATVNSILNRETGDEIILDITLAPDDVIHIDLVNLRVWSEYGFIITPQPGSRFASWALLPTGNTIDIRVNTDAATVTGTMRYVQRYHSYRYADVP